MECRPAYPDTRSSPSDPDGVSSYPAPTSPATPAQDQRAGDRAPAGRPRSLLGIEISQGRNSRPRRARRRPSWFLASVRAVLPPLLVSTCRDEIRLLRDDVACRLQDRVRGLRRVFRVRQCGEPLHDILML